MHKVLDCTFWHRDDCDRQVACRLRIFSARGCLPVVIVTDSVENRGATLTEMAAELAMAVWRHYLPCAREGFRWIEHHTPGTGPGTFDEVHFQIVGARDLRAQCWVRLDADALHTLVGDALRDAAPLAPG